MFCWRRDEEGSLVVGEKGCAMTRSIARLTHWQRQKHQDGDGETGQPEASKRQSTSQWETSPWLRSLVLNSLRFKLPGVNVQIPTLHFQGFQRNLSFPQVEPLLPNDSIL